MTFLYTDGSFEGLLTAVFEIYERKLGAVHIAESEQADVPLFTETLTIISDDTKSDRVWKKMTALFGKEGARTVWKAWLSEDPGAATIVCEVIRYGIAQGTDVLRDFGNLYVLELQQLVKKVRREKHRMEAFIRFEKTKDGIYFAIVEPDFNVLPLIIPHFQNRYADQEWIIYDGARKYGIWYNLHRTQVVDFSPNEMVTPTGLKAEGRHEEEEKFQQLWANYFRSTNIAARKNSKLHKQHVPRRYWKFLTEKRN
jgi:probable DNA metabolism protein